ncbi:multidrug effflux MFS transporter [Chachezhania antarctica]|uniref:multidrug effflux MFS transporter n=1 Tax=Chachezhania antarctica TaxID=2340860 RepID=UPI000EB15BFB|nr:multidrug effflux MFS transporter [Chachezhania antarctica]|tara:strand:+ start:5709 stop:6941 length:1233 start_codon:yes stop_codon:yes gene_type:complete
MNDRISRPELVALLALMFASIAFSMDAMLPALPQISAELSPDRANLSQLILTVFILGLGLGTFIVGPISDAFGRRSVILCGVGVYVLGAVLSWQAQSLETLLIARFLQGAGAAAPRVVGTAVLRDLYEGRAMAKLISLVMMLFVLFPAVAPLIGTLIMSFAGWRGIFAGFVVFALIQLVWVSIRLPETLPPERRRPLRRRELAAAFREIVGNATVRLSTITQTLVMTSMFTMLLLVQPVFFNVFGMGETFPYWFFMVAIVSGGASILNASLVMRLGMRRLVVTSLSVQIAVASFVAVYAAWNPEMTGAFPIYIIWMCTVFAMIGLTVGNLNAIALEPVGHIAGMAASVVAAIATFCGSLLAVPFGLTFNGWLTPAALGIAVMCTICVLLMRHMERLEGRVPVTPPAAPGE